ncbi:MAG: hypothetical protein M1586_01070 [Patescibacteria group bacterium]|nr:hypothetical protein [Patescibacteria group bacterium]MCL5261877.1 hypothetical protein [Patescibacteria group bacterium]
MNIVKIVKIVYLYLFSLIGLVLIVVASVKLVNLGLKALVFTAADQYYSYPSAKPTSETKDGGYVEPDPEEIAAFNRRQLKQQREREAADALAMLIVGAPLYIYHWRLAVGKKDEE